MASPRLLLILVLALAAPLAPPVSGDTTGSTASEVPPPLVSVAEFGRILHLDDLFATLREEGLAQADEMATAMIPGGMGPAWDHQVDRVYDLRRLRARFNAALRVRLVAHPALTAEAQAFFASDLGQRVIRLEIEARRAFLDIAQEEAARVAADTPETARDPKWALIRRIIEAGDLVESNVAAGLTGSLGFSQGLQETGITGMISPIDDLALEVWGQEAQIRADAAAWLKAYFGLAYSPLTETELSAYVDFLESPAGRHYSAALAYAFGEAFGPVSRDLGKAIGSTAQAQDI